MIWAEVEDTTKELVGAADALYNEQRRLALAWQVSNKQIHSRLYIMFVHTGYNIKRVGHHLPEILREKIPTFEWTNESGSLAYDDLIEGSDKHLRKKTEEWYTLVLVFFKNLKFLTQRLNKVGVVVPILNFIVISLDADLHWFAVVYKECTGVRLEN